MVVKDGLKECPIARKLLSDMSAIVKYMKKAHLMSELRRLTGKGLILVMVVRWNASLDMSMRYAEEDVFKVTNKLLVEVNQTSKGKEKPPKPISNRQHILDLIDMLEPFTEGTDSLQGDGVTAPLVIPTLLGEYRELEKSLTRGTAFKGLIKALMRSME